MAPADAAEPAEGEFVERTDPESLVQTKRPTPDSLLRRDPPVVHVLDGEGSSFLVTSSAVRFLAKRAVRGEGGGPVVVTLP